MEKPSCRFRGTKFAANLRAKDADEAAALEAKKSAEAALAGARTEMHINQAQLLVAEAAARL